MSPTHYLPHEEITYANYPELLTVRPQLEDLQQRLEAIITAASEFEDGLADRIYLDISEVQKTLKLAYDISEVLGKAPRPCFDILTEIRDVQESLHEILFSNRYEGNEVVADPQMRKAAEIIGGGADGDTSSS